MTGFWRGADPLVLASKSKARRSLLASAGIPFEVVPAMIDERAVEAPLRQLGAGASDIARHLARAKALAAGEILAAGHERRGRLVLGADQTLSLEGRLFSKPGDRASALAQIEALSGRTHELHSALCLVRNGETLFEAAPIARIRFRPLHHSFIEAYLEQVGAAVCDSVGAYQIEGLGIHLVEAVEGDHATILGLPLTPLLDFLRKEGSLLG